LAPLGEAARRSADQQKQRRRCEAEREAQNAHGAAPRMKGLPPHAKSLLITSAVAGLPSGRR